MCIYQISFIRVYLSIYCLQPAGWIFIKSFLPPLQPTNHHHHLTNQPTTDQVFCLHLQRSIRSFYIFHIQPSTMITIINQDDQPSIKSFLHLQYPANNLMIKVIFSYLSQELPAIICETLSETFTMLWSYLWNILFLTCCLHKSSPSVL